jgi:formylglycine-generating enzyme required for sulfatase activity
MIAHSSFIRRGAEIRRGAAVIIAFACLLAAADAAGQETAWKAPEMIFVPGGTFTMGTSLLGNDEKPEH